jgi:hypothetical protein
MNRINKLSKSIVYVLIVNVTVALLLIRFSFKESVNAYYIGGVAIYYLTNFVMIYFSKNLLLALPGRVPLKLFSIGAFIVIGGIVADMVATITCSPDLSREANVIILMLMSAKMPLNIIYASVVLISIIQSALALTLFSCFLKAYPILVESIPYKNILITSKWLFGLSNLQNWKDFLSFKKTDFFCAVCFISFLSATEYLYRFYVALMWFDKVPYSITVVPAIIVIISTLGLAFLLHYHIKKRHYAELALN